MANNAVGSERVSRVVGYKIKAGNFNESSPNLPQSIAIVAEANTAFQASLDTTPRQITNRSKAAELYGDGSPIVHAIDVLFPRSGGGLVGGIPVWVYPQAEAEGATARELELSVTGTATGNGTHNLYISGRAFKGGVNYEINISSGDTADDIAAAIEDVVNRALACPLTASAPDASEPESNIVTLTTKWKGLTAQDVTVRVDTGDRDLGITYTVDQTQAATGTPSIQDALDAFGETWHTIVINGYGTVSSVVTALEEFNGTPDPDNPTGRFTGTIMKPFVAITGTTADDPTTFSDASARKEQVTIALAPAPGSEGLPIEAAANMAALFCRTAQDTPHLDVAGQYYPDMPVPADENIGSMADYNNRDSFVKKGCSTVKMNAGRYQVQDFVTTYHKVGEEPPAFRWVRNLYQIDTNVYFGYYLKEQLFVVGHAIASDSAQVTASKVIKPSGWKGILYGYYDDLEKRALIVEKSFSKTNTSVSINSSNPDRLDTEFKYKRSGFGRISSTEAEAGFNTGN